MSRFPGMGVAPNTLGRSSGMMTNPFGGPVTGMEGVAGGIPGMALGMMMQTMGSGMGAVPLGMGPQNTYDRLRQRQMSQDYTRFMGEMSERDRGGYRETLTGVANMMGIKDSQQRSDFINTGAGLGVKAGGFIAQMAPELLDAAMGSRGSAAVMGHHMYYGSRFRTDPVTGQAGMGKDSLKAMGDEVFGEMFDGGFYRDGVGLSAGQTGAAFKALQRQGMITATTPEAGLQNMASSAPGGFKKMLRDAIQDTVEAEPNRPDLQKYLRKPIVAGERAELKDSVGGIDDLKDLSPDVLDKAAQSLEGSASIRKFDSSRVIKSLKDYSGAIKAMREIFGDAGNPNAPMPELISGLEAMTGGAMTKLQPGTVEQMARTTYNLAKGAGVGMPGIAMMSQSAQAQAIAMGLDPVFGARAVQHGLSTMQAYQQGGYGANPAWGKGAMGEIVSMDQQLTLAATESDAFNQAATAERLTRTAGEFKKGSRAAEYMEAWRSGKTTFGDKDESIVLEDEDFINMVVQDSGGKISRAQAVSMMRQRKTNAEYGLDINADFTTRKVQSRELDRQLANQPMAQAVETAIGGEKLKGVSKQDQRILSEMMAKGAAETLRGMSSEDMADTDTRQAQVAEAMRAKLEAVKAGGGAGSDSATALLKKYDGDDAGLSEFMSTTGENVWGETSNWAARNTIFKSAQNMYAVSNPKMMQAAEARRDQAGIDAQLQSAMAPLGKESILRSAVEAIQNVDPEDERSIEKVFVEALGGVSGADVIARVAGEAGEDGGPSILETLTTRKAALDKKSQDLSRTKDHKKRQQLKTEIREEIKSLNNAIGSLGDLAESQGMFLKSPITKKSVAEDIREQNYVTDAIKGDKLASGEVSKGDFEKGVAREQMSATELVTEITGNEKVSNRLGSAGMTAMEGIVSSQEKMQDIADREDHSIADILGADDAKLERMHVSKKSQDQMRKHRDSMTANTRKIHELVEDPEAAFDFDDDDADGRKANLDRIAKKLSKSKTSGVKGETAGALLAKGAVTDEKIAKWARSERITEAEAATLSDIPKMERDLEKRGTELQEKIERRGEDTFREFAGLFRPEGMTDPEFEKYIKAQKSTGGAIDRMRGNTADSAAVRGAYKSATNAVDITGNLVTGLRKAGKSELADKVYTMSDDEFEKEFGAEGENYNEMAMKAFRQARQVRKNMAGEMDGGGIKGIKGIEQEDKGLRAVEKAGGADEAAAARGDKDADKLAGGGVLKIEIAQLNVSSDDSASLGGKYSGGNTA